MKKVLLIGWDAMDWRTVNPLLDAGLLPHLGAMVEDGVMGDLGTLSPPVSSLLWASLLTGQRANRHGLLDPGTSKVASRVPALWHRLATAGKARSVAVGWSSALSQVQPGGGTEPSAFVAETYPHPTAAPGDPWPMPPGIILPPRLESPLAGFRVSPEEIDSEILHAFVPRAEEVDQDRDPTLARIALLAADSLSIHAAATWLLEEEPWEFAAIRYPSLGTFAALFLAQSGEAESLYKDVLPGALRLHDLFLGTLRRLAGPEATLLLCSPYGTSQTGLLPTPEGLACFHGHPGLFCCTGPGIRKDERIDGASLLDLVPTLLHNVGAPLGEDLEGRVLAEIFVNPPEIIVEPSSAIGDVPHETLSLSEKWHLIHVYLETSRPKEAVGLLETVHHSRPENPDVAVLLAHARLRLGLPDEASNILDRLAPSGLPAIRLLRSQIAFIERRYTEAQTYLEELEASQPNNPSLQSQMGFLYLAQRLYPEARRAFRRALKLNDTLPAAHLGMAQLSLTERRYPEAADAALLAVRHQYQLPQAHFFLGMALYGLGMYERAALAFETSLRLPSPSRRAHGWLARLYQLLGNPEQAAHHRDLWKKVVTRNGQIGTEIASLSQRPPGPLPSPTPKIATPETAAPLFVLTGLPHSGLHTLSSLLAAGGLRLLAEEQQLTPQHIAQSTGAVLLLPYALLPQLPSDRQIRIIVTQRPAEAVLSALRSEQAARHIRPPGNKAAELDRLRREHAVTLKALAKSPNFEALVVDFNALRDDPTQWIERLETHLAPLSPNGPAMRAAALPTE